MRTLIDWLIDWHRETCESSSIQTLRNLLRAKNIPSTCRVNPRSVPRSPWYRFVLLVSVLVVGVVVVVVVWQPKVSPATVESTSGLSLLGLNVVVVAVVDPFVGAARRSFCCCWFCTSLLYGVALWYAVGVGAVNWCSYGMLLLLLLLLLYLIIIVRRCWYCKLM